MNQGTTAVPGQATSPPALPFARPTMNGLALWKIVSLVGKYTAHK
jgi:hypothetical protein